MHKTAQRSLRSLADGDIIDLGEDKKVTVLHLPGHSAGSIGFYFDGVLATGDTVYATDHELIDWYPGSSSRQMSSSVTRILEMSPNIEMALPGHNAVLSKAQLVRACEGHLRSSGKWREMRKALVSRPRARLVLAMNSFLFLPSSPAAREWIKN